MENLEGTIFVCSKEMPINQAQFLPIQLSVKYREYEHSI